MARLGWILFLIMTLIASGLAYKFIISGETEVAPDGRTTILLEDSERDFLLHEMRNFLIAVQQISEGIEKDDMTQVVRAAKKVGSGDLAHVPAGLMGKMPLAAKKMGLSTHKAFDQMAMDAEQLGDKEHVLSQLNQILPTCTACHALYKTG
ncbi:MAG: hypothetical protein GQ546_02680 [Gammaproteobacteria bacterium]|jgi:hypothetical protein|nr:hypothetical protein [Gammaproteobacteria bacterium]